MKRIAIVGMGDSRNDFLAGRLVYESAGILAGCEVWAVNYMAAVVRCDKAVIMDPLDDAAQIAAFPYGQVEWLKKSQLPIISCKAVEGFNVEVYPIDEVTKFFNGFQYFNTSVAYAVALAITQGATEILLFGVDFTYKDRHFAEAGRACVEFWLGVAVTRGISITVAASSTLLDQATGRELYGYHLLQKTD